MGCCLMSNKEKKKKKIGNGKEEDSVNVNGFKFQDKIDRKSFIDRRSLTKNNLSINIASQKSNIIENTLLSKSDLFDNVMVDKSSESNLMKNEIINVSKNMNKKKTLYNDNLSKQQTIFNSILTKSNLSKNNNSNYSKYSTYIFNNKLTPMKTYIHSDKSNDNKLESIKISKNIQSNKNLINYSFSKTIHEKNDRYKSYNKKKEEESKREILKKKSSIITIKVDPSKIQNYRHQMTLSRNVSIKIAKPSTDTIDNWEGTNNDTDFKVYIQNLSLNIEDIPQKKRNTLSMNKYFGNLSNNKTIRNKQSALFDTNHRNSLVHHFNDDYGDAYQINNYRIIKELGKGSYGVVKLCENIDENDKRYAMKIIDKNKLKKLDFRSIKMKKNPISNMIENEIKILNIINHPNAVKCFEIIDKKDHQYTYFILEYMKKGSLKELVEKGIDIKKIWNYFRHLLLGIEYCHEQIKLIHFDIKPDNLLIDENNQLKITDFGISYQFKDDDIILKHNNRGTPFFKAPELTIDKPFHGKPCDIWSMGVTLYYTIYKIYPFYVNNQRDISKLNELIRNKEIVFPQTPAVDDTLKDLISKMVTKDPEKRITLQEIIYHPWVTANNEYPLTVYFNSFKDRKKSNYFSSFLNDQIV